MLRLLALIGDQIALPHPFDSPFVIFVSNDPSASNLPAHRPATWKWTICGLLLLASAINYMDRQTLANAAVRIKQEFYLSREQYGHVEAVFAYAFAAGSVVFGWAADRFSVRWLYAIVLTLWSLAGLATGFVHNEQELVWCRMALGFFEAGHWPCGIRTTRALLDARERSLGNSVLQSGTSVGAIITPLIMSVLMTSELSTWRTAFQVVGVTGFAWLVLWFALVRGADLPPPTHEDQTPRADAGPGLGIFTFIRRMLIIFFVIALINTTWQILRAWLPQILQEGRGYSEEDTLWFTSAWYLATDIGCLGAGALAVWLGRRKLSVHAARVIVFAACGALCASCALTPWLAHGWVLLAVFMLAGAGALGLFPLYHAFTQDLSGRHQGKITGIAGVVAWVSTAWAQQFFGKLADRTHSFDQGLILASFLPLIAVLPLWLFWESKSDLHPSS
ncbi:MFS transporter [Prosthecobacter sp.]|uniref:MFS transporter n=1 Tax=Prosthecobacter sp. TaxID=1965333 RepID=UPI003784F8F7